jgi:hypothetical protein
LLDLEHPDGLHQLARLLLQAVGELTMSCIVTPRDRPARSPSRPARRLGVSYIGDKKK